MANKPMTWEISLPLPLGDPIPDTTGDAHLLARCRRGELAAYERLYRLHAERMKSMAFHLLGNQSDAEDAVQETFLKVYRGVNGFDEQSALSTWIYRILINSCYDILRKRVRRAEKPITHELPETQKLPLKVALERALLKLNPCHRLVFLMYEVEGLKHSEISGALEVPEGTSRAWLFEAKQALKRLLMGTRYEI